MPHVTQRRLSRALTPFATSFRRAEDARPLAWLSLERAARGQGTWHEAALACQAVAEIFAQAARAALELS